ncbi:MAG: glycosyltransferase family 2 protein [Gammaproteobacteria bacterium]|nr:glycosyltransferase family 2 protein [Gammaproteobacteria bacterium]
MTTTASITIAISTYNRPKGLKKLLDGLAILEIPEPIISTTVVVADNSLDGNAEQLVKETSVGFPWKIVYLHVPERGITFPRNSGLREALDNGSDYLAYIDDDEVPHKKWIWHLFTTLKETGAAVVSGGVIPIFQSKPSWWIEKGGFFEILGYPEKQPINYAHTSSVLIDTKVISDLKLVFNHEFRLTGGEDTHFFKTMRDAGYKTVFCKESLVYETITSERAKFGWLLKRWFRTGNTDGIILARENNSALGNLKLILQGIVRALYGLIFGLVKAPLLIMKNTASFEYIRIMMRGFGFIGAATGMIYQEYRTHKR